MPQFIKAAPFISVTKGVRGLSADKMAMIGADIRDLLTVRVASTQLKPGEETPLVVTLPQVPRNADVKSIKATIKVTPGDSASASSITQTSKVTEGDDEKTYTVNIDLPPLPLNISLKLQGGEVFWSAAGPQVQGAHKLPDFSEQANAHFDALEANQTVAFTFLVKSDGPGTAEITISDVEYSVIQTQSWTNPLDDTVRLDRNFELDYGTIETVDLDAFDGKTRDLFLFAVRADVSGEMGPERLLGDFEAKAGNQFIVVSPENAVAQGLELGSDLTAKPIHCVGVAAAAQVDAETELYLEIQPDATDSPAAGAPLAKVNLTLATPQHGASAQWMFAQFDAPVELSPQTLYWIVVKGIRGRAILALQEQHGGYLQRPLVNRSGQLWREFHSSAAADAVLLRLVYLPDPDNQSSAIAMNVDAISQQIDPTGQTTTVSLDLPSGRSPGPATLRIKSHARGRLSIANVIREYSSKDDSLLIKKALFTLNKPFSQLLVQ